MVRSRLQRLEEKRSVRTATLLGIGTVVLIILVVIMGVPTVVKMAAFLAEINSANKPVDKNDFIPPPPPLLSNPYPATNSASQVITGSAEPGVTVHLSRQDERVAELVAAEDGSLHFGDVRLVEGENKFSAVAVDSGGNISQTSRNLTIFYLTKQPTLEISAPSEGTTVSGSNAKLEVKGKTDVGARIIVNQRLVIVDSEGNFSTLVTLVSGENKLVVEARDQATNVSKKEIVVNYQP
ncbi:MAG: hypothetical protein AAB909_04420 [Patescibacteria group bacterium]